MCKYEMNAMSIVEDTEQTRFCPQMDKVKPVYPPFNFVEARGIKMYLQFIYFFHTDMTQAVETFPL